MIGSMPFSLEKSANFERSFKKLVKAYKIDIVAIVGDCLEGLLVNPYSAKSRDEPLPKKPNLPQGWTFHKVELRVSKGASGQIRILYLVNDELAIVKPLWIYSHEQFTKRPPDGDIDSAIKETFDDVKPDIQQINNVTG
jgi:mRNA-degrading endonuclease RelE of RelBE toxin-antitoxin system